jgi:hypothetical protein
MILPVTHPSLDQLAELNDATAAHVRGCPRCQESLRFVRRLEEVAPQAYDATPPADVLSRALEARAAGARYILPSLDAPPRRSWRGAVGVAAAAAALFAIAFAVNQKELVAEDPASTMSIRPERPRMGDTIRVVYSPAAGLFPKIDTLALRARFRTQADGYYGAYPQSQVRRVAVLRRTRSGDYTGSFALPPGVVFAAFAVETHDASVVDANGTRLWEVMIHGADQRPTFEALDQRIHDMMGRSWEEAYATSKRQTLLYPDRISSWSTRRFFERALYGEPVADSIAGAVYQERLDNLLVAAKALPRMTEDEIGTVFFNIQSRARRDSSLRGEVEYWWQRIRREYPRHSQVAQYVAYNFTEAQWKHEHRFMLDSLERAYPSLVPLSAPAARNLIHVAMRHAEALKDHAAVRRWAERFYAGGSDSAFNLALGMAQQPVYSAEAVAVLRSLLAAPDDRLVARRGLTIDAREYARRVRDAKRRIYVEVGRALIAGGRTRAGLDTLQLASAGGVWNVEIFQSLVAAYLAAGDTANADIIRAKLAIDPRTPADSIARMTRRGIERMGPGGWEAATNAARAELHSSLRDRSKLKAVRGRPLLTDGDGNPRPLRDVTGGQPALIVFWNRECPGALEALPSIVQVAKRLTATGRAVILVNDGAASKDASTTLRMRGWTLPVYYDGRGMMAQAFNNFGTPSYYVLDGAGRIRFEHMDNVAEAVEMLELLAAERL